MNARRILFLLSITSILSLASVFERAQSKADEPEELRTTQSAADPSEIKKSDIPEPPLVPELEKVESSETAEFVKSEERSQPLPGSPESEDQSKEQEDTTASTEPSGSEEYGAVDPTEAEAKIAVVEPEKESIWPSGSKFDRVEGGTVFFAGPENGKAPKPLKTNLYKVEYLGELFPEDGDIPYFVLSGQPCASCKDQASIYIIRADGLNPMRMTYPGKIRHRKTGRLVFQGRSFFGTCIPGRTDVFLSLRKEKVDRRRYLQHSAFIAEIYDDKIREQIKVRRRPTLRTTLRQVRKKKCKEIKGFNRRSLPLARANAQAGSGLKIE